MPDKETALDKNLGHFLRDNNLESYIIKPITKNDKKKTLREYMKENGIDDIGVFSLRDKDEREVSKEVRICFKCKRSDVEFYESSATRYCKGCWKDYMKEYNRKKREEATAKLEHLREKIKNLSVSRV
jgi:hypothetical protein